MSEFRPLLHNPHLLTILGNYWPRKLDLVRFPAERRVYQTEPGVRVLVYSQQPQGVPRGQLVLVHGLEGSSDAGYKRSMTQHALEAGFAVHRFNMRGCGGTEGLAGSDYHAGQTSDLLFVLRRLAGDSGAPLFIGGFSLGGNVVLKLAGELGEQARGFLAGVIAISTPIDLARCVEALARRSNFLYSQRFVRRLKDRIRNRAGQYPELYDASRVDEVRTVFQFDDWYTARFFGFGTAGNYYATQSSKNFLAGIRVPALIVQAKDDPLIPFEVYDHPAFDTNPYLKLIAVDHGGHLGFIARGRQRFWLDAVVVEWISTIAGRRDHSASAEFSSTG